MAQYNNSVLDCMNNNAKYGSYSLNMFVLNSYIALYTRGNQRSVSQKEMSLLVIHRSSLENN